MSMPNARQASMWYEGLHVVRQKTACNACFMLSDRRLHAMRASCCHSFVNASALMTGGHERIFLLNTLHMQHPASRRNHLICGTCLTPGQDAYRTTE